MKTTYKLLLSFALTFASVIAPSLTGRAGGGSLSAQTIGDAFYIYRNDGNFNAFFRDEIDSIAYSNYDLDSLLHDDIVTQVVFTEDSVYRIPLEAIDSVSFVQPETIYRENTLPIEGSLYDYLIKMDGMTLFFDARIPVSITPKVGDKLVVTGITEKFPHGFVGKVRKVNIGLEDIAIYCDSIALSDAVSQFYDVLEIGVSSNGLVKSIGPHKSKSVILYDDYLPHGPIKVPTIDFTALASKWNDFDINVSNNLDITFTPNIYLKLTRVVDDIRVLSHTSLLAVTNADVEMGLEVSVTANADESKPLSEMREWKCPFLAYNDFPIVTGISFYFEPGLKATFSGGIATGFTLGYHIHQTTEITYYDISLQPVIGNILSPIINHVKGSIDITTSDMRWDFLAAQAEVKLAAYLRTGLSALTHKIGWVGGEFDGGLKINGDLMFDIARLQDDETKTTLYDELKNAAKLDIKPYIGAHFMASAINDKYVFSRGEEFETPLGTWFQGRPLPEFLETKARMISNTKANITAKITNDCPIPYTVGFALYNEYGYRVSEPVYYNEKYWTRHAFPEYSCDIEGLEKGKRYKIYPVIRWFDKYDMLCSPSTDLDMSFPVEISELNVNRTEYGLEKFPYNGLKYNYRFSFTVTASLVTNDMKNIEDWGVILENQPGELYKLSLLNYGQSCTYPHFCYRNQAHSIFTVYGYVKYIGSDETVYGDPIDFRLDSDFDHEDFTLCPDDNHPHLIDLGIGTRWSCCNIGATKPEEYGGYYAWGEVTEKDEYTVSNYKYKLNGWQDYISGTENDAAYVSSNGQLKMPYLNEAKELLNCNSFYTVVNGVKGMIFTGPNGNSIFFPSTGYKKGTEIEAEGISGYYWIGQIQHGDNYSMFGAYRIIVTPNGAGWLGGPSSNREEGLAIRAIAR